MIRKLLAVLTVAAVLFAFAACDGKKPTIDQSTASTVKHTILYTDAPSETSAPTTAVGSAGTDDSWKSNYTLVFSYADTTTVSKITETRFDGYYCAADAQTGYISYFVQNGTSVEQYALDPASKTGVHQSSENNSLSTLTSGFMKVSFVAPTFKTDPTVTEVGTEDIAGRPATRYLQQYNSGDALMAYAFVWIDNQYGFASKCAIYTTEGNLYTAWELESFSVGTANAATTNINLAEYTITEN